MDKSFFQEPKELNNLINMGGSIQNFLQKQADIDKILKVIQRKFLEVHIYQLKLKKFKPDT